MAYTQAYGLARLDPATDARPEMRYAIGSISKQFTAAAVLLLAEDGKLSLDDPVGRFLPTLTRASDVTIREVLSHTSGYQDYWPEDYVMPPMLQPTTTDAILDTWARKPLDFEPGTKWQYSNTNYVIAGRIVELVSGMPLARFLQERIFTPLGMRGVANVDTSRLGETDAVGYLRHALGPPRPAPKEGRGWLFAAAELAMPVADLARWDIALIDRRLLMPAPYDQLTTEVRLKNGTDTHYALGLEVATVNDHRMWEHSGEVSGFVAENMVLPDDRVAVVVLTNLDASSAAGTIARQVRDVILTAGSAPQAAVARSAAVARARTVFVGLQRGRIDRGLFTPNANAYFDAQALADYGSSLGPMGSPRGFCEASEDERGGMTFRRFAVTFRHGAVVVTTYELPDGRLEQYLVEPIQGAGPACRS
jgi:CubicO group peptidase (beta-lactamase class C family)